MSEASGNVSEPMEASEFEAQRRASKRKVHKSCENLNDFGDQQVGKIQLETVKSKIKKPRKVMRRR